MAKHDWHPTCTNNNRLLRASLLADIRQFFQERGVLEVETPILSQHTVTDVHIESFQTTYRHGKHSTSYYLQTSPEYAMKRLLAAGSGPIYQICKAFRQEEHGQYHNPEFSMLEWYQLSYSHHQLMDEVDQLLQYCLQTKSAKRITYQQLFIDAVDIDPFAISDLTALASQFQFPNNLDLTVDHLLQFIFADRIEATLGMDHPVFIYDFPSSQAALARINPNNPSVAERVEVYLHGLEIGNGFHELNDPIEQKERFLKDQEQRQQLKLANITIDERLINSLSDLPNCAGIAVGIDRLLMVKANTRSIRDVINFPWEIA